MKQSSDTTGRAASRHLALVVLSLAGAACGSEGSPSASGGAAGHATGGSLSGGGGSTASGGAATGGSSSSVGGAGAVGGNAPVGGAGSGGAASGGAGSGAGNGGSGAALGGAGSSGGMPAVVGGSAGTAGTGGNPSAGAGGTGAGGGGLSGSGGSGGSSGGAQAGSGGSGGGAPVTCPSPALAAGNSNQTVMVGSVSRSYVLHVPAAYDASKAAPLVIDFHGLTGSGSGESTSSPYPAQTDPDGVIMAFPTGLSGPSGAAWNVGPCCVADVDDVAFAKAMVTKIATTACIDPKRVYAVGFSMGGGMSHYLACHAADVFAAVAPAAFDLLEENVEDCTPPRPITVVSFRGTSDPIVPYAGGDSSVVQGMPITFLGAKATFAKWASLNACTGAASAEDSAGCSSYSGCAGDVDVVLCTKQGGNHEAGNASVAWPILKKHVLP